MNTIPAPKFESGQEIKLGRYSFVIHRIELEGKSMWRYHGQMKKDGRNYNWGTVSEQVLMRG